MLDAYIRHICAFFIRRLFERRLLQSDKVVCRSSIIFVCDAVINKHNVISILLSSRFVTKLTPAAPTHPPASEHATPMAPYRVRWHGSTCR